MYICIYVLIPVLITLLCLFERTGKYGLEKEICIILLVAQGFKIRYNPNKFCQVSHLLEKSLLWDLVTYVIVFVNLLHVFLT